MTNSERKNHPYLAQLVGPYVQAAKHDGLLFLSGLTALGSSAQGRSVGEQLAAIGQALANIAKCERTDLSSLVKVTLFVTSLSFATELRAAWSEHFADCSALSSLVQIGKLQSPDVLVEVEAVLALPPGSVPSNGVPSSDLT
ncbi:MAG TPA: RidA family protein [Polyangiaceae bacterium]|nr:RidA family protein [Polyangiaceae bacterium]